MWVFLKNMKWGICWFFLSFKIYWDLSVLTKQFLYNSALFEFFICENEALFEIISEDLALWSKIKL
jgi:hypothetical protein